MATKNEVGQQLEQKSGALREWLEKRTKVGEDGKKQYDFTPDEIVEFNTRNDELTALGKQFDSLHAVEEIAPALDARHQELARKSGGMREAFPAAGEPKQAKSLGEMATEHADFKRRVEQIRGGSQDAKNFVLDLPGVDVKTLMERSAGYDPETQRQDKVVLYGTRPVRVPDLIPSTPTTMDTIRWMEETTFTNNTAAASEGSAGGENALVYTERSSPVEKVSAWLPVTDEQLMDVPQLRALIDNRLSVMLALALENLLVNGTGATPQPMGFLNKPLIQTQAKGDDPATDAIYKAFTKVRWTGYAEPSGVIINPNNWQEIRLLRDLNGNYIFGSPSDAGPERIWGKPVVVTNVIAAGTALVGDFALYSELFRRLGAVIESTNSHSDYFPAGKQAIRIVTRVCLVQYRAGAFCSVTSLP